MKSWTVSLIFTELEKITEIEKILGAIKSNIEA